MTEDNREDERRARFPIGVVARRTGLSKDVLRVWESRYGVVRPARSESGRRLYSEADVERLALLRAATASGWSIGEVAHRSDEELRELTKPVATPRIGPEAGTGAAPAEIVDECLLAVEGMDGERLEAALSRGMLELPGADFLEGVVAVLLWEIGERWRSKRLDPGQEHLASVAIRTILARMISAMQPGAGSPRIVLTTLAGEDHELGAMLAAASAATAGWRATFIGANLPAEDIVASARRLDADALGLSLVAASEATAAASVAEQLNALRRDLGDGFAIYVGGSAAGDLTSATTAIGARRFSTLEEFRAALQIDRRGT